MKKLVMLLFVLALCVPSYGASDFGNFLVYRVTITDKPVITDVNFNNWPAPTTATAIKSSASFKGYLVLDANDSLVVNSSSDACSPALILNGTDPETKAKKQQWMSHGNVDIQKVAVGTKTFAELSWNSNTSGTEPNDSWADTLGNVVGTVLVKGGAKVDVPKSLKGNGGFEKQPADPGVDENTYLFTGGPGSTATLTLDTAKTKKANASSSKTVADVVADTTLKLK